MPPRFRLASDVAIDLGTANTRVLVTRGGSVEETPTLLGHGADTSHPLRAGVVVDVGGAAAVLEPLLKRAKRFGVIKPRALACVPADAKDDERAALEQAARAAGASEVTLIPEPLAAALGAGIDVASEYPRMLVDFGDGLTEIAVLRCGEIVTTSSLRIGCGDIRLALADSLRTTHKLVLTEEEADRLVRIVCANPIANDVELPLALRRGSVAPVSLRGREVATAVQPLIEQIADFVSQFVFDLPNNDAVCIIEDGITATGGGALLPALRNAVTLQSGIEVIAASNPLYATIRGAGMIVGSNIPSILR